MTEKIKGIPNSLVPKKLSVTRWSACSVSCKALFLGFSGFKDSLQVIVDDTLQLNSTRVHAKAIQKWFGELKIGILLTSWHDILTEFATVSKSLQKVDINISLVARLHDSLIKCIGTLRK